MNAFHGKTGKKQSRWRLKTPRWTMVTSDGLKLFTIWLLGGALILAGFTVGVFLLLVGWLSLPLLRYWHRRRGRWAFSGSARGNARTCFASGYAGGQLIEGDYEIRCRRH